MNILDQLRSGRAADTVAETRAIAADLAQILPPEAFLALCGPLGAGKTTFVQGLAGAWEIRSTVKSPTFNIVHLHLGRRKLVHVDAYRLGPDDDLQDLILEEWLQPPFCVALEWPDVLKNWLPQEALWLEFQLTSKGRFIRQRLEI